LDIENVINMFQIDVPMFPLISVTIVKRLNTKEIAAVFRIQDGGSRHFKKYISG